MAGEIFLISDPHFGHENVINFGNRPFDDANHMTEVLVERWNKKVGKRDQVICLGDWSMAAKHYQIADRLNGMKRLVLGNHDTGDLRHLMKYFHSVHGSLQKKDMLLTHIPILMDEYHRYDWVVHGHLHDASQNIDDHRYINVNMDAWDYEPGDEYSPIHIEDVRIECRKRKLANWRFYTE